MYFLSKLTFLFWFLFVNCKGHRYYKLSLSKKMQFKNHNPHRHQKSSSSPSFSKLGIKIFRNYQVSPVKLLFLKQGILAHTTGSQREVILLIIPLINQFYHSNIVFSHCYIQPLKYYHVATFRCSVLSSAPKRFRLSSQFIELRSRLTCVVEQTDQPIVCMFTCSYKEPPTKNALKPIWWKICSYKHV